MSYYGDDVGELLRGLSADEKDCAREIYRSDGRDAAAEYLKACADARGLPWAAEVVDRLAPQSRGPVGAGVHRGRVWHVGPLRIVLEGQLRNSRWRPRRVPPGHHGTGECSRPGLAGVAVVAT